MIEKFQTLQTLCQIGVALFSILAILCGYGAYHFGEKKENAKNPEISIRKDSAVKAETTYHIKGDLIQGDKVTKTKKEEINAPSALIVTKNQSGGTNTINYFQNEYKSLDHQIIEKIDQELSKLTLEYPNSPRTIIEIESGNSQRNKIALALEELLSKKNLGVYLKGNTSIGRFPDYPISIFINPSNKKYTEDLLNSIELFITGEFKIIEDERFPIDVIKIYINGQPLFDTNGKVKVQ
jgi:hypothetical protein